MTEALYLAIPQTIYERLQTEPFLLRLLTHNQVKYFIYSHTKQEILSWKN